MTTQEIINLLENALDCDSTSPHHSGFTAREIHRKCLAHIKTLDQALRLSQTPLKSADYKYIGWGKGKDE